MSHVVCSKIKIIKLQTADRKRFSYHKLTLYDDNNSMNFNFRQTCFSRRKGMVISLAIITLLVSHQKRDRLICYGKSQLLYEKASGSKLAGVAKCWLWVIGLPFFIDIGHYFKIISPVARQSQPEAPAMTQIYVLICFICLLFDFDSGLPAPYKNGHQGKHTKPNEWQQNGRTGQYP